ncbi:MAG: hypothetical protein C0623_08600 [Desulfuromonas sp.]|nr:MAG: hypothetical protein C0623_08600 [Desulfuromonas sp.]
MLFNRLKFIVGTGALLSVFVSQPYAGTLDFAALLQKTVSHSLDYQIALSETEIERHKLGEVRSILFPSLYLRFGNEYAHIIGSGGVDSVGDVVIANDESSFKHSMIASTKYNLFSFGVDSLEIENAEKSVQINELNAKKVLLEAQLSVLASYSDGLKIYKRILAGKKILKSRKIIFKYMERLHKSGTVDANAFSRAAVELAEESARLEELYVALQQILYALSALTGEEMNVETVELSDLRPAESFDKTFDVHQFPEVREFGIYIEQKKNELSAAKRRLLPTFSLSGSYRMFGSDTESFSRSLSDLEGRDVVVTIYMDWPLFAGFKQSYQKLKLREELRRLELLRLKRVQELENEINLNLKIVENRAASARLNDSIYSHLEQIEENNVRLSDQQLINKVTFEKSMIENAENKLDSEIEKIDQDVAMIKLGLWGQQI